MLTTQKRQETSYKQNECAYHVCNYLYWVFIETLTEDKTTTVSTQHIFINVERAL